jgi:hypothetical protein
MISAAWQVVKVKLGQFVKQNSGSIIVKKGVVIFCVAGFAQLAKKIRQV